MRFIARLSQELQQQQTTGHRWDQRVDPVEHATVPRQNRTAVLDAGVPLQKRLVEISGNAQQGKRKENACAQWPAKLDDQSTRKHGLT
jgi:hypothetical protein